MPGGVSMLRPLCMATCGKRQAMVFMMTRSVLHLISFSTASFTAENEYLASCCLKAGNAYHVKDA